jgi:ketosteroid isomerase-like protein
MGRLVQPLVAAALLVGAATASASVAPLTPDQKLAMDRKNALEDAFRARFDDRRFNQVRDMYARVIVADKRGGRPALPRVLFKDEEGWHELVERGHRPLPSRVAHELDRLMVQGEIWAEPTYEKTARCAAPQVFIVEYGDNEKYGHQCGHPGLIGRVTEVAARLAVPAGRGVTTAPPPGSGDARYGLGPAELISAHISGRVRDMIYAWDRRSLAGAVDPYAEDVIVEFADGKVLRGRAALAAWMRPQQDWSTPGVATQGTIKGVQFQRGTIKAPVGNIVTELREIRWQENGRALRRTYSANWRNNDGLWQIVHERVSADKPVTDERLVWP